MTLQRRTPLGRMPRAKGNRGELAVRNMMRAYGWQYANRNWRSGAEGGGDIIHGPTDVHAEVKWCETAKVWEWLAQAEGEARPTDIPVVFCRCNKTPWFAVLPRDEWEALHKLSQRPVYVMIRELERASLWSWIVYAIGQAKTAHADVDAVPVVQFRRARSDWFVAVPADVLLDHLKLREAM